MGGGLEYLQRKAAEGHKPSIQELNSLVVPENARLWSAFNTLSRSRGGFGGQLQPIAVSEMIALSDSAGAANRQKFIHAMQAMDRVFLEHHHRG